MATSPDAPQPAPSPARPAGFAELHVASNFSFLRGASHPEELVERAWTLGYAAIAITDECSVAGAVRAHAAAKECNATSARRGSPGIQLIVGAEFRFEEGAHLTLLAPTRLAYGQLSELITRGRRRSPKGAYSLTLDDLHPNAAAVDECLALWMPGMQPIGALLHEGRQLKALLPHLWIALELFLEPADLDKTANALVLATRLELPIVASNDVHLHSRERKPLQDVLTAIREHTTVAELGGAAQPNCERCLRPIHRLAAIYPPEALDETVAIARRCRFSLDELQYEYPEETVPPGQTPTAHLRELVFTGARARWPDGIPAPVREIIDKELEIIRELGYEHYFLTVHDIARQARSLGILCQGRGSAANSAVCYCLHVTEVDPSRMSVLFERFISKERNEPPDIDIDFEHERREEIIQYIYRRYGRHRAALAATVITYRPRSAIRDVGRALDFDAGLIDALAKSLAWWDGREALNAQLRTVGIDPDAKSARQFLHLVNAILGFPRHLSQHVGGFVIARGALSQLVPIENAAMPERTVIQWDKDDLEALGLLKVDVLGLGMLTAIRKTLALANDFRRRHGAAEGRGTRRGQVDEGSEGAKCGAPANPNAELALDSIPAEDPHTYAMLQRGDSVGVFQVESRAQMSMLPRLRPECFYDLVIEVAIVRPGPIQGDMVHPYLRRRQGLEPVTYSDAGVRRVLERTLGVPIFQEQVIELAMVAAGFSGGEADQLRRAMAAWKRRGGLGHFEKKLIDGMLERGHDREFAERIFRQIQGFGEYGFPESHAASFALLVYVSAWLKRHETSAFYCGLLNSLPMGFYSASQLLQDAAAHGVEARPVDVQSSGWDYRLEPSASGGGGGRLSFPQPTKAQPAIRIGLRQIKGLAEETAQRIAAAQPFRGMDDLSHRAALSRRELGFLARAGALKSLAGHRHQAHWDAAGVDEPSAIWREAEAPAPYRTRVRLESPSAGDDLIADYRYLGLTTGPHPMALLRGNAAFRGCRTAIDLLECRPQQFVQVAGIVTCRQRPGTASGVVFMTLEDETGNSNIVIWSTVLERFRAELLQGRLLAIKGVVEREGEVIHVVAGQVRDLTDKLAQLSRRAEAPSSFRSRNFH